MLRPQVRRPGWHHCCNAWWLLRRRSYLWLLERYLRSQACHPDWCSHLVHRIHHRLCFAEHRQNTVPADFDNQEELLAEEGAEEAEELLDRLYQVCEEEATEGKKKAHRKWWQLYWEAQTCEEKRDTETILLH